jgi:hypothetical protein
MHGKIKLTEKHSSSRHDCSSLQVTSHVVHAARVESRCARVCPHISLHVLSVLILRTTQMLLYELEYVKLDEQCGTKVHMSSLHITLAFQLNLG